MARYNLVQIGDIYFTSDGTGAGIPCKVGVTGLDDVQLSVTGQTIISANGIPWTQVVEVSRRGVVFKFSFEFIDKEVHEDIVALMESLLTGESTETMNITGDLGNFSLTVKPFIPDAIQSSGAFSGGILKNVNYSFITT